METRSRMAIGSFEFAVAKDAENKREYLVADTWEEIDQYCGNNLEVINYAVNPTPIMVAHHFKWVGKGKRPAQLVISKPFNYANPNEVLPEKW
tara:strand:- start:564 stop:842 length:279 start_codon:yes stop_codon:yes gene_type:complete